MGGIAGRFKDSNQFLVGGLYWNSSFGDSLACLIVSGMDYLDKIGLLFIILVLGVAGGIVFWFEYGTTGDDSLNESLNQGSIFKQGTLTRMDASHWGNGNVKIIQKTTQEYELQFESVEIATGPDLYVYLSDKPTFTSTSESPGNFVDLGKLPAQSGNFTISIPTSDLSNIKLSFFRIFISLLLYIVKNNN